jgi:hypothetical protein
MRVIFGFKHNRKKIFFCGYIPGRVNNKAFINNMQVSYTEATLLLRPADVFPRAVGNMACSLVLLNSCPPESLDNDVNFFYERSGEKDSRHVVNRDRRNH